MNLAMLNNFFGPDTLIIFLVLLLLFGAKKLPELARGMGQAVREFSKAKDEITREVTRPPEPEPVRHLEEPKAASRSTPETCSGARSAHDDDPRFLSSHRNFPKWARSSGRAHFVFAAHDAAILAFLLLVFGLVDRRSGAGARSWSASTTCAIT